MANDRGLISGKQPNVPNRSASNDAIAREMRRYLLDNFCPQELSRWKLNSRFFDLDSRDPGESHRIDDKVLLYHEGEVYPGIGRSVHRQNRQGNNFIVLRIRTTDETPDLQLIAEMQEHGIDVMTDESKKQDYNGVTVSLEKDEEGSYYQITAQGVRDSNLGKVRTAMERVGKTLLQAKELVQNKDKDSEELARKLCSGKLNLQVLLYDESHSTEVAQSIRGLAARYLSNPGILDKPLISLFEAGDLADSAFFTDKPDALRECVRRQVGAAIQGTSLTVMDFSKVFHRICDAMGIPTEMTYDG